MTAQCLVCGLGLVKLSSEEKSSDESSVDETSGAAVGLGCPGGTAQGTCRPGKACWKVLRSPYSPRSVNATERSATRRGAPWSLQTMTAEEGLSLREAVESCGSGALTVREVSRLRQLAHDPPGGSGR